MATDELDELLLDRFHLHRSDLIAALKTLPAHRPWAAALTADEARLLDDAGFTEDPDAYAEVAVDTITHTAVLYRTAYSAAEVREGLNVSDSRVRQRRLARTLWAIDDDGAWVYPAVQFELCDRHRRKLKAVRGLDDVFSALLTRDLHPTAIANFLTSPQPNLQIDGEPTSVRDWLIHGEAVDPVLDLIDAGDWAAR